MLIESERELNHKIVQILESTHEPSSVFADFVGIKRPAMSHIINFRNKPSLEIIQKITSKFPDLEDITWTYEGEKLSDEQLSNVNESYKTQKAAQEHSERESSISKPTPSHFEISDSKQLQLFGVSEKKIMKIVLIYDDKTFSEILPSK